MRLVNGFRILNVSKIMDRIKKIQQGILEDIIENDPKLADDKTLDNNKIT